MFYNLHSTTIDHTVFFPPSVRYDSNTMQKQQLIQHLYKIVAKTSVLVDKDELHPYECDGLSAYKFLPWLVVLPESIKQIQQIVKLCFDNNIPIIARGAGTGLSGGTLPQENSLILSLAKLNQILSIDPIARSAHVQPGVRNLAISTAAEPFGLYYAPDPSSQIACSIGGNVAENSGGVHCLKYGLTVHNILEVKIVSVEGELITLGGQSLDSAGYDLLALITGSEGLLGIIVDITVKLLPIPEKAQVLLAAFDNVLDAGKTVGDIIANGIIPAGLEMMDKLAINAAEDFAHAGYPKEAAAILLCELDGTTEEVEQSILAVKKIAEKNNAESLRISQNETERALIWTGRKAAFPAVGRLSPDYYCMDGTIPKRCLPEVLDSINKLSEQYNLPVANVFHAGDGNLHPLILYDANIEGELERTEEFGAKILELCVKVGGTITGEHGVGIEKIDQMCIQFQSQELQQFHSIKAAFDQKTLLNPGKAVPSLHRCAELGGMHVHDGQLPHPELDRF